MEQRLTDGSYLRRIYASSQDGKRNGIVVRVIDYTLEGVPRAEPIYKLVTSIPEPEAATAGELARLYHERWEIETARDELRTRLRGWRIVLRSKTPDLVRQEFYGMLPAHFAIRAPVHEAALAARQDPDDMSFVRAFRVMRRRLRRFAALPREQQVMENRSALADVLEERAVRSHDRVNPRGVKRKTGKFRLRPRARTPTIGLDVSKARRVLR